MHGRFVGYVLLRLLQHILSLRKRINPQPQLKVSTHINLGIWLQTSGASLSDDIMSSSISYEVKKVINWMGYEAYLPA